MAAPLAMPGKCQRACRNILLLTMLPKCTVQLYGIVYMYCIIQDRKKAEIQSEYLTSTRFTLSTGEVLV